MTAGGKAVNADEHSVNGDQKKQPDAKMQR